MDEECKITKLINNRIKDSLGRDIVGIAQGTCKCGKQYSVLVTRDERENGSPSWSAWCGSCPVVEEDNDSSEIELIN